VSRVLRLYRETGAVKRRPYRGAHFSPIRGPLARLLGSILKSMPDATVAELTAALWGRTGLETSRSSVLRALHRQGYSRKKSCSAVERSRPENLARRRVFCALLTLVQLERFVFLGESYCATGMRRDFAWAGEAGVP
jgi:transposase